VTIEVIKISFVAAAYHIGMLKISEFIVLYLATARMSSYKLLGLLLMLTNKGGPILEYKKQYKLGLKSVATGVVMIMATLVVSGLSMHWALYMGYFRTENQTEFLDFSFVDHLLIPVASEFVFRGFLMEQLGRDLGSWFGIIGSAGWFGILHKGQNSAKFIAAVQGGLWSIFMTRLDGNLLPSTIAHVAICLIRTLCPSIYFSFFPDGL